MSWRADGANRGGWVVGEGEASCRVEETKSSNHMAVFHLPPI